MADGEWLSAPMIDFQKDPRLDIICEDGRPSYFQARESGTVQQHDTEKAASNQHAIKAINGHHPSLVSSDEKAALEKSFDMVTEMIRPQPLTPDSSSQSEEEATMPFTAKLSQDRRKKADTS